MMAPPRFYLRQGDNEEPHLNYKLTIRLCVKWQKLYDIESMQCNQNLKNIQSEKNCIQSIQPESHTTELSEQRLKSVCEI